MNHHHLCRSVEHQWVQLTLHKPFPTGRSRTRSSWRTWWRPAGCCRWGCGRPRPRRSIRRSARTRAEDVSPIWKGKRSIAEGLLHGNIIFVLFLRGLTCPGCSLYFIKTVLKKSPSNKLSTFYTGKIEPVSLKHVGSVSISMKNWDLLLINKQGNNKKSRQKESQTMFIKITILCLNAKKCL